MSEKTNTLQALLSTLSADQLQKLLSDAINGQQQTGTAAASLTEVSQQNNIPQPLSALSANATQKLHEIPVTAQQQSDKVATSSVTCICSVGAEESVSNRTGIKVIKMSGNIILLSPINENYKITLQLNDAPSVMAGRRQDDLPSFIQPSQQPASNIEERMNTMDKKFDQLLTLIQNQNNFVQENAQKNSALDNIPQHAIQKWDEPAITYEETSMMTHDDSNRLFDTSAGANDSAPASQYGSTLASRYDSTLTSQYGPTLTSPYDSTPASHYGSALTSQPSFDFTGFPPVMNILVLGETGVGKSTFINGLINYLNYEGIQDALDNGVHILIRSAFTLTDEDYNTKEIISEPTIPEEHGSKANESTVAGQSATQEPRSYVFTIGEEQQQIRIIDTPGIGDTRGIDQDKKNFDKILSFISGFSELHAICILIKPNTARLTLAFRFCIDELLVHLHKSACNNILFCFTNTRGTLYKPGDTLPTLREHLTKLDEKRGIKIPLDKSTLFSFDNESFRFLCAKQEGMKFTEIDEENFNSSWNKSVAETQRLFRRISELPVHKITDTLCLNNTRNLILALTRPLAAIARNQMINMQLIKEKMEEVNRNKNAGLELRNKLYVNQVVIIPKEIDKPQTVCTSKSCVDYRKFSPSASAMQTIYKTVCHVDCQLQGVQVEICPNTSLQSCSALHQDISKCRTCGCPWTTHMHIRYKLDEVMEKVTDPDVEQSIRNKDNSVDTIKIFLSKEQQKIDELKKEHDQIILYCAEFAAFLANNSILPYNDSYGQYVEHMIKEEEDKVKEGGGKDVLDNLKKYKDQYDQQVKILTENMNAKARSVKSVEEINAMVAGLSKLKHCGSTIEEIKKIQLHSCHQSSVEMGKKVQIGRKSNFGNPFKKLINRN